MNHAISQTARQKGQLAVLFLDLADFKNVNDSYGHDAGDGVLKRAAERLRACVRAGDTIARLGGGNGIHLTKSPIHLRIRLPAAG